MIILLDNGHGCNTHGKCSPDRRLMEWRYTRDIAAELERVLKARGYDARRIVTEDYDVALSERCRRVNSIDPTGRRAIVVSIHCNAAGADDRWHQARGWSCFVCPSASKASRSLAERLADAAAECGLPVRRPMPTQSYWTMNLAICRGVRCPSVLTENLFQDCRADIDYLLSPQGRENIVRLHVKGIIDYITHL